MTEPQFSARPVAFIALALILPVFAVAPLLYPGYFEAHSGYGPLWNLQQWRAAPFDVTWLPAVATHFDPLRSDGLLPYYLVRWLPLSPVVAVKLVMGGAWLAGSLGLFLWLRSWLGDAGALVSALVYTYLPFQIAAVYVRGAWGEVLFWGVLPWLILTATYLVTSPRLIFLLPAALFWLLGGLSQLGLTLWALLFVAALLLIVHFRQSLWPLLAAGLGTGGALVFYRAIGAFVDAPPAPVAFDRHFLYPFQLFSAMWDFGPSRPGWNDGLSLQLGLAPLGLAILTVYLWTRFQPDQSPLSTRLDRRLLFFGGAVLALAWLMLGGVGWLWAIPGLPDTLTYPWQLLGLAGLSLAVLAGAAVWLEPTLTSRPLFSAVILFILLSSYPYLEPRFSQPNPAHLTGPAALLGDNRLALLEADFSVEISGSTAGMQRGSVEIPLAVYGPLTPGADLHLNVHWQPLTAFESSYKIFVHLVDGAGKVITQFDGYPQDGDYPTLRWNPGEIITDSYLLTLPANLPPGPYRVYLGLYNEADLVRLPVSGDDEGRVILTVQ